MKPLLDCQYGHLPPVPAGVSWVDALPPAPLAGGVRRLIAMQVDHDGRSWSGDLLLVLPPGPGPFPVLAGLNFLGNHTTCDDLLIPATPCADGRWPVAPRGEQRRRWDYAQAVQSGLAVATLHADCVLWDAADPTVRAAHPGIVRLGGEPGAIAAWAWALQRIVDVLAKLPVIDPARVILCGHSRMGKAALLAAATDPRVAAVIDNQSGTCGGAPSTDKPADAESCAQIQQRFPHWFTSAFASYAAQPERLPCGQDALLRAIAPRPLLQTYAAEDRWADPDGAKAMLAACADAWPDPDRIRHVLRPGKHDVFPEDWTTWINFIKERGLLIKKT